MSLIWSILYVSLDSFVWLPIRYYVFKDRLRFPYWKIILMFALVVIGQGIFFNLYIEGNFSSRFYDYCRMFFATFYFLSSFYLIKDDIFKVLFFSLMLIPISFMGMALSYVLGHGSLASAYNLYPIAFEVVIRLIFTFFSYPVVTFVFLKYLRPALKITDHKFWVQFCFIPLIFNIITYVIFYETVDSWPLLAVRVLVLIGGTLCCVSVVESSKRMEDYISQKEKAKTYESLLSIEENRYKELSNYITELRKFRHDYRHNIGAINVLANNGDLEGLKEYLKNYSGSLPELQDKVFCENLMLNAIFSFYYSKAKEMGIRVNYKLNIPNDIKCSCSDLCILIGNLFENAIEAQNTVNKDNRFISIRTNSFDDSFYLVIENTFDGKVLKKGEKILSKKRDYKTNGLGIESIKAMVDKYNGDFKIEYNNNKFSVSVML
ncbi:MAG: GHKL domain-containing protein [Sphaerochaetaceae bacterium]|nr:GHKL domain-containing protein [Sphaerochaetaceae bacterium]